MTSSTFLERLGRVTSSGRLIPQIDGLRFVAISTVIIFHLAGVVEATSPVSWSVAPSNTVVGSLAAQGHYGVELFFAISGFILAMPFAKCRLGTGRRPRLGAYYLRRLTRLEPPYILSLLLLFVLQLLNGRHFWPHARHLLASLVYQHNLVFGAASAVNAVAWSLEVEVQFYLLAPALGLIYAVRDRARRRGLLVAIWAASILFKAVWLSPPAALAIPGPTLINYFEFFWIGFILADLFVVEEWEGATPSRWWDLVSVVGWPLLMMAWLDQRLTAVAFPALVALLYTAALRGKVSGKVFSNRWLVVVGGMCYTLYLFHLAIIAGLARFTRHLVLTDRFDVNVAVQLTILGPVVLVLSAIFFVLVERPCMRPDWPRQLADWARIHINPRSVARGQAK